MSRVFCTTITNYYFWISLSFLLIHTHRLNCCGLWRNFPTPGKRTKIMSFHKLFRRKKQQEEVFQILQQFTQLYHMKKLSAIKSFVESWVVQIYTYYSKFIKFLCTPSYQVWIFRQDIDVISSKPLSPSILKGINYTGYNETISRHQQGMITSTLFQPF